MKPVALMLAMFVICADGLSHNKIGHQGESKAIHSLYFKDDYEFCFDLGEGQRLKYQFEVSELVEFNIHYHLNGNEYYPIFPERLKESSGSFVVNEINKYCLMWLNNTGVPIKLNFKVDVEAVL